MCRFVFWFGHGLAVTGRVACIHIEILIGDKHCAVAILQPILLCVFVRSLECTYTTLIDYEATQSQELKATSVVPCYRNLHIHLPPLLNKTYFAEIVYGACTPKHPPHIEAWLTATMHSWRSLGGRGGEITDKWCVPYLCCCERGVLNGQACVLLHGGK